MISRRAGKVEGTRSTAGGNGRQSEPLPIDPISVRIPTAVRLTGISRSRIYELIGSGDIETMKIGRSTFILYRSLKRLVEGA